MKEAFYVLSKDRDEKMSEKRQVQAILDGITSQDPAIVAAKTNVFKDYHSNIDKAIAFLSSLISSVHTAAKSAYTHRQSNKRRYVSSVGSDGRGRGRARRGGDGRGRDGRGRGRYGGRGGGSNLKKYMNGVDVSDPHRNFTSDEWTKLGSMRSTLLILRQQSSGRGGRGGGRGDGQRNASSAASATALTGEVASVATNDQATAVSELNERGSQNGRGFGRGAYN